MPLKNAIALILSSAVLLGCVAGENSEPRAETPTDAEVEAYNARVDPDERIVCRDETPVGTFIPRRTCRLQADVDSTSTLHREQLRRALQ